MTPDHAPIKKDKSRGATQEASAQSKKHIVVHGRAASVESLLLAGMRAGHPPAHI
jgi:hypothetical protein